MAKANSFEFEDYISILEEMISNGESVNFTPGGRSMLPSIRAGRDSVTVSPAGDIKKYDIALYRRANGKFVLHRIVIAEKDYFVMCGDNQFQLEYPVTKEQIIGKVSAIKRKGKLINTENPGFGYKLYIKLWDLRLVLDKGIYYLRKLKRGLHF